MMGSWANGYDSDGVSFVFAVVWAIILLLVLYALWVIFISPPTPHDLEVLRHGVAQCHATGGCS